MLGLAKVVRLEHPDLNCRCIDLDPAADSTSQIDLLFHEIRSPDEENIVAYRGGRRLAPRLDRSREKEDTGRPAGIPKAAPSVRLEKSLSGVLEEMSLVPVERHAPGKGEVEIEVRAVGLGFKDVMNALGMLDDQAPLGFECSGRVAAVGEGVDHVSCRPRGRCTGSGQFCHPRDGRRKARFTKAALPKFRRSRDIARRLPHRPLCTESHRQDRRRGKNPDPCGRRRSGHGGCPPGPQGRRGGIRNGRKCRKTRLPGNAWAYAM